MKLYDLSIYDKDGNWILEKSRVAKEDELSSAIKEQVETNVNENCRLIIRILTEDITKEASDLL